MWKWKRMAGDCQIIPSRAAAVAFHYDLINATVIFVSRHYLPSMYYHAVLLNLCAGIAPHIRFPSRPLFPTPITLPPFHDINALCRRRQRWQRRPSVQ